MNDYEAMVKDLESKLSQTPMDTEIMNDMAIGYMELNEYEKAFHFFEEAAKINPSVQNLNNLGYFYITEGELVDENWEYADEKARKVLEKAVSQEPKSHFPYSLLGEHYISQGNYERASELLSCSVKIRETVENLNNLGVCFYMRNNIQEAKKFFYKASQKYGENNDSLSPLLSYGICLAQLGMNSEAKETAERLLMLPKYDLNVGKEEIADIYYELRDYSKVIPLFDNSILSYSMYWVPMYLYSIKQIGDNQLLDTTFKKIIDYVEEQIMDIKNDDDDDWSNEDRESYINELRSDIENYKKAYTEIQMDIRPALNYQPSVERTCYLFGCKRHQNPHYID